MNLSDINNILNPIGNILKKGATMNEEITIEIPENPHTHIRPKCKPGTHCEAFPHGCYCCIAEPIDLKHDLYKDGDDDIPEAICDRNGQVVLSYCKICSGAEATLPTHCPGRKLSSDELDAIQNGELDF